MLTRDSHTPPIGIAFTIEVLGALGTNMPTVGIPGRTEPLSLYSACVCVCVCGGFILFLGTDGRLQKLYSPPDICKTSASGFRISISAKCSSGSFSFSALRVHKHDFSGGWFTLPNINHMQHSGKNRPGYIYRLRFSLFERIMDRLSFIDALEIYIFFCLLLQNVLKFITLNLFFLNLKLTVFWS